MEHLYTHPHRHCFSQRTIGRIIVEGQKQLETRLTGTKFLSAKKTLMAHLTGVQQELVQSNRYS